MVIVSLTLNPPLSTNEERNRGKGVSESKPFIPDPLTIDINIDQLAPPIPACLEKIHCHITQLDFCDKLEDFESGRSEYREARIALLQIIEILSQKY